MAFEIVYCKRCGATHTAESFAVDEVFDCTTCGNSFIVTADGPDRRPPKGKPKPPDGLQVITDDQGQRLILKKDPRESIMFFAATALMMGLGVSIAAIAPKVQGEILILLFVCLSLTVFFGLGGLMYLVNSTTIHSSAAGWVLVSGAPIPWPRARIPLETVDTYEVKAHQNPINRSSGYSVHAVLKGRDRSRSLLRGLTDHKVASYIAASLRAHRKDLLS